MRSILFRSTFIVLLILVIAGCTGGEKPVETVAPETTVAPTTTAPPTTVPPTTAPPASSIDLSSPETDFEKLLPSGHISLTELTEANVRLDLNYPIPPRDYIGAIEAKYPPETQTINLPYPYSRSYKIVLDQGSINILKFKTESSARNYYQDIKEKMRRNSDFNVIEKEIKMNDKSLYVRHKLKDEKYYATQIQKGIFIFQIDPGVETTEDAEAYIIGNMDYLFE